MELFNTNTQLFTSLDVNWGTGVVWIIVMFYQLFGLSFWRHPFTVEDPLVSKWYNAKFLQICSDQDTNSSTIGWPEGTDILSKCLFLGNYFFNRATEFKPFRWVNKQSLRFIFSPTVVAGQRGPWLNDDGSQGPSFLTLATPPPVKDMFKRFYWLFIITKQTE